MGSDKAVATVITLLTICLLLTNTSAAYSCCRSYTNNRIPFKIIKGFTVQTATSMCRIDAIIFHTTWGKGCFNPALPWVMSYINKVSNAAQGVHNKNSKAKKRS
ncbi:C-C motif chemokine 20a.3 [Nelusetta ayraudi]|uniref:C-C motif chemokine 20a.3 n=1 Tax=Nelusetta ayraudi TaxID=303726 RepID=UPI003F6EE620